MAHSPLDRVREPHKPTDGGMGVLDSLSHAFKEIATDMNKAIVKVGLNAELSPVMAQFPKVNEIMSDGKLTALMFNNTNSEQNQMQTA